MVYQVRSNILVPGSNMVTGTAYLLEYIKTYARHQVLCTAVWYCCWMGVMYGCLNLVLLLDGLNSLLLSGHQVDFAKSATAVKSKPIC